MTKQLPESIKEIIKEYSKFNYEQIDKKLKALVLLDLGLKEEDISPVFPFERRKEGRIFMNNFQLEVALQGNCGIIYLQNLSYSSLSSIIRNWNLSFRILYLYLKRRIMLEYKSKTLIYTMGEVLDTNSITPDVLEQRITSRFKDGNERLYLAPAIRALILVSLGFECVSYTANHIHRSLTAIYVRKSETGHEDFIPTLIGIADKQWQILTSLITKDALPVPVMEEIPAKIISESGKTDTNTVLPAVTTKARTGAQHFTPQYLEVRANLVENNVLKTRW